MMKKIVVSMVTVALLMSFVFVGASFAATKNDILAEAEKSPLFHYVEGTAVKMLEQVEITEDQAAQIIEIIKGVNAVVTEDKGPSYVGADGEVKYIDEERDVVVNAMNEICAILGIRVEYQAATAGAGSSAMAHENDIKVIFILEKTGQILGTYDGDLIKDTSSSVADNSANYILVAVGVLVVASAVMFVYAKRRVICK